MILNSCESECSINLLLNVLALAIQLREEHMSTNQDRQPIIQFLCNYIIDIHIQFLYQLRFDHISFRHNILVLYKSGIKINYEIGRMKGNYERLMKVLK